MHDAMPTGIRLHNLLLPRQGNGHTRHALLVQSLASPQPSTGYCYPSCPHNAKLQRSFPASLHQQSRNASCHQPHYYWLAWGHQESSSSPPPILATQRDPHHQGQSGPVRWSTHHSSCQKGENPASTASIPLRNNKVTVACMWKFLLAQHKQGHRRSSLPVWSLHPVPEPESCSTPHTYTHTIMPMADVCHWYLHARRSRLTHAQKLPNHRLTNTAKHLCPCILVNQLQCMTPSERFGFLLLWYVSYLGTAIKYAPAMVPHTATCGDTFMNAVSKWSTLSQVVQLPHCRLPLDTASQQHNLHCPPPAQHMQLTSTAPTTLATQMNEAPAVLAMPAVPKNAPAPMPVISHVTPVQPRRSGCAYMAPRCLIQEI